MKARAEARFIPAGEHAARIGGFELRAEHHLLRARAVLLIRRLIESLALLVDLAGEIEGERVRAGGSSVGSVIVSVSCFGSSLIADFAIGFSSSDALVIL